ADRIQPGGEVVQGRCHRLAVRLAEPAGQRVVHHPGQQRRRPRELAGDPPRAEPVPPDIGQRPVPVHVREQLGQHQLRRQQLPAPIAPPTTPSRTCPRPRRTSSTSTTAFTTSTTATASPSRLATTRTTTSAGAVPAVPRCRATFRPVSRPPRPRSTTPTSAPR